MNESQIVNLAVGGKTDKTTLNLRHASYRKPHARPIAPDLDWLLQRLHHTGDLEPVRAVVEYGRARCLPTRAIRSSNWHLLHSPPAPTRFPTRTARRPAGTQPHSLPLRFFGSGHPSFPRRSASRYSLKAAITPPSNSSSISRAASPAIRINRTLTPSLFEQGLVSPRTVPGAVSPSNILIPASHPFNFFVREIRSTEPHRAYIDPANWNNAIHQAVDVSAIARPLGSQFNDIDREIGIDYWRGVAGVDFDLTGALECQPLLYVRIVQAHRRSRV